MKKIALLVAVFLMFSVVGCSSSKTGSDNADVDSQVTNQSQQDSNGEGEQTESTAGDDSEQNGYGDMFKSNIKDPNDIEVKLKKGLKTAKDVKLPFDQASVKGKKIAVVETQYGDIYIELYPQDAPGTVMNFEKLSNSGYYDGLTFHRVEPGFVVQGGDPQGNGTGGPGYNIKAEINSHKHLKGTVAMARRQISIDSAGSQFYICLNDQPSLDGEYTVFGQVIWGMDVVEKIKINDKMKAVSVIDF